MHKEAMDVRFEGFCEILPGKFEDWYNNTTKIDAFSEALINDYKEAVHIMKLLNNDGVNDAVDYFNSVEDDKNKSVIKGIVFGYATKGPKFYERTSDLDEIGKLQVKKMNIINNHMIVNATKDLRSEKVRTILNHVAIEKEIETNKELVKTR